MESKRHYYFIALAGCIFGSVSLFSALLRDEGVSSFEQSFLRVFLAMLFLVPLVARRGIVIPRNELRFFLFFGFITALLGFSENSAIALKTPVAVVVLLMYTQPVWTALLSHLFLGEALTQRKALAIALSLSGIALITEVWGVHLATFTGPALALFSGFLLSCEFVLTKIASTRNLHYTQSLFFSYGFRVLFTALFGLAASLVVRDPILVGFSLVLEPYTWGLLLLYALVPMVVGMMILFSSMRHVPVSSAGIILLLEPMSAVIYSYMFLGESIVATTIAGGILILLSSYLSIESS